MLPTPHILRRAIVVAGLCLAVAPAAASADSLVFIKSGNVWLSHSDGSGAYGSETRIFWYPVADARSGSPAVPDPSTGCATGAEEGLAGPTWSPDGSALALESKDGIWVKRQARDCTVQPTLAIPGGSAPDWGPADVNPAPRGGGSKPPAGGGGVVTTSTGGVTVGPLPAPAKLQITKAKLAKALRSGLKVTLRGARPGRQAIVAKRGRKVVARGTATVGANGVVKVTLRFTRAAKRALRGARVVKLTVLSGGAKAAVTLKR